METLLVFAKSPRRGSSKTRLAAHSGEDLAVRLATAFLLDTAEIVRPFLQAALATDPNRRIVIAATDVDDPVLAEAAMLAGARLEPQVGDTLGERLEHAFSREWGRGARSVAAIGTDSPTLPLHLIELAFRALLWSSSVVGPSFDDGYWLIGLRSGDTTPFASMPFSTRGVMPETLQRLRSQGHQPHLLPFWYDVDEHTDFDRLRWHCDHIRQQRPTACRHTAAVLGSL
jgi:uncharacterized protein